ncbi:MAG TPA: hypothetical protein DD669_13650 [Pseudomonas sp.]|nr:hypothetical protein [Pseudomonas sp.]
MKINCGSGLARDCITAVIQKNRAACIESNPAPTGLPCGGQQCPSYTSLTSTGQLPRTPTCSMP